MFSGKLPPIDARGGQHSTGEEDDTCNFPHNGRRGRRVLRGMGWDRSHNRRGTGVIFGFTLSPPPLGATEMRRNATPLVHREIYLMLDIETD